MVLMQKNIEESRTVRVSLVIQGNKNCYSSLVYWLFFLSKPANAAGETVSNAES